MVNFQTLRSPGILNQYLLLCYSVTRFRSFVVKVRGWGVFDCDLILLCIFVLLYFFFSFFSTMQFAIENTFDLKNLFVAHSCILKKKKLRQLNAKILLLFFCSRCHMIYSCKNFQECYRVLTLFSKYSLWALCSGILTKHFIMKCFYVITIGMKFMTV